MRKRNGKDMLRDSDDDDDHDDHDNDHIDESIRFKFCIYLK